MWNSRNDNDLLDFALLWDPLGGPAPENVAAAFSIDMREYNHRLRGAARIQMARLQQGITSAEHIYGLAAITALERQSGTSTTSPVTSSTSTSRNSVGSPTAVDTANWAAPPGAATGSGVGFSYLHHAVDDHSRLAYSEILGDEKKETAAGFWIRARDFFAAHHITATRVLMGNGSCYRSKVFADALGPEVTHKRTRPYRPQTNGKVERFNRALAAEWAYADTYVTDAARSATYHAWLHHYNHHRPHTGISHPSTASPFTTSQELQLGRDRMF